MHDISDGGLLVALAEMAMPRGIGAEVPLGERDDIPFFFGEDQGRYLIAAPPAAEAERILAEAAKANVPVFRLARTKGADLILAPDKRVGVAQLRQAHESWFPGYMDEAAR